MDRRLANVIFLERFVRNASNLDSRSLTILVTRVLSVRKVPLDEVGRTLNLTRERVRQIEHKLLKTFAEELDELRDVYRDEVQTSVPRPGVISMLNYVAPFGSRAIERFDCGEIDFSLLGRVFGHYEVLDGICFIPNGETVKQNLLKETQDSDHTGLFSIDALPMDRLTAGRVSQEHFGRALRFLGFTQLAEGRWIYSANYVEAAAALLNGVFELSPLAALRDAIDPDISLKSFRQRLMQDARFSFPDSTSIKLLKDGEVAERPTTISALIEEVVPLDGNPVPLQTVIDYVQSKRAAADSSIRSFASRPPFVLDRNQVSRALEAIKKPRQQPCRTRNLYRLPNGWAIRLKVTDEHIRGSSITLPVGTVNAFNLELRVSRQFKDLQSEEAIWLNWDGSQPKARSIRRNLVSVGAKAGDDVMLVFHNDDFWVHKIPAATSGGVNALASLFPGVFDMTLDLFLYQAFMCHDLGGVPLLEAMKLRREFDLVARFEGEA
jgi:hypothetical protein